MSLFEQYNQDSFGNDLISELNLSEGTLPRSSYARNGANSSGYVRASIGGEPPIFSKKLVEYSPPSSLVELVVSKNRLVMSLADSVLVRLDLARTEDLEEIQLSKRPEDAIHGVFLDPAGYHLIVSTKSGVVFYLNSSSKKVRQLNKLKGILVESIAWNSSIVKDSAAKPILLGTSLGEIYEADIEPNESGFFREREEKYVKKVFEIDGSPSQPVTGLRMECFPVTLGRNMGSRKYLIMAITPTRLYQFIGTASLSDSPVFLSIFDQYRVNPGFRELPGDINSSELHFFKPADSENSSSFSWLTGVGVLHGNLLFGKQETGDSVIVDSALLPYKSKRGVKFEAPISMVLTQFHIILAYSNRLEAICKLNEQVVYEDFIPKRYGKLLGLSRDDVFGTVWAYCSDYIFEIEINQESRNIWKLYLERKQFDLAMQFCHMKPEQADQVLRSQADDYFENHNFMMAANIYAKTCSPFEDVALAFVDIGQEEALRLYLARKLKNMSLKEKTQRTMICTWLVELYLNALNNFEAAHDEPGLTKTREEFHGFLGNPNVLSDLDKPTTYEMMSSHGRVDELLHFASSVRDHDKMINHFIQQGQMTEAISVLGSQHDKNLYYKYSSFLMLHAPELTVNSWIAEPSLDPRKLLSAIVRYEEDSDSAHHRSQAIRYLEHCVLDHHNVEPAIHNYLASLYSKSDDEKLLLDFLYSQGECPMYDRQYVLRLCIQRKKIRCCVYIYGLLDLFEEAVTLALSVDLELAKVYADRPEEDEALRKKLWLKIARHVVEEEQDIQKAMAYLQQCSLLKIEDILPFFPDFLTIDHFKDAICSSLEDYNRHIEELKGDMADATESSAAIRADVLGLRNKYGIFMANDKCAHCSFSILSRPFYIFPCQHLFHVDCLTDQVMPSLSKSQRVKVFELRAQISKSAISSRAVACNNSDDPLESNSFLGVEEIQAQLDDIIAAECFLCGDPMIRLIEKPFISRDEFKSREECDQEMELWRL